MSRELLWLTLTIGLTALMWVPYIIDRIKVRGMMATLGNPSRRDKEQSPWAIRMMFAHDNAIENLVIFATLVLAAQAAGIGNGATAMACVLYFWARVVHLLAYTFALPWVRTLAFAAGFVAQAILAWQLLMR